MASKNYRKYKKLILSTICIGDIIRLSDMLSVLGDVLSLSSSEHSELVSEANDLVEVINTKLQAFQTGDRCGACGLPLYLSDLPQYGEVCHECEINF